ncbi:MAG: DoxX family protein [Vicinamibacterales bacterium]
MYRSIENRKKLFGWPSTANLTLTPLLRTAACIELTSGVCILVGLVTEVAALVAAGEMAFAYFLAHFPLAFWPIANDGVSAVLFCFAFLFIAVHGSGLWSVESLLWHRRSDPVRREP